MRKYFAALIFLPILAFAGGRDAKWVATGKNLLGLKGLPIVVFLPTDTLAGYTFFDYSIEEEKTNPNYMAIFLKDASHWYQIESSNELGDADWDDAVTTKVKIDYFGEVTLQTTKKVDPSDPIKTSEIISDWMCGKDFSREKPQPKSRCYHIFGRGITAREATRVIKSLKKTN